MSSLGLQDVDQVTTDFGLSLLYWFKNLRYDKFMKNSKFWQKLVILGTKAIFHKKSTIYKDKFNVICKKQNHK